LILLNVAKSGFRNPSGFDWRTPSGLVGLVGYFTLATCQYG
jgi:hypothetical protein